MFETFSATAVALSFSGRILGNRAARVGGLHKVVAAGIIGTALFTAAGSVGVIIASALTYFA